MIELVAQWRDQGVARGLAQTTQGVRLLTTAIGTAAGFGAIGSVSVLARALGELARAPFEAANSFADLARQGKETAKVFRDLAAAQDQTRNSWQIMKREVAESVAPAMTAWERYFDRQLRMHRLIKAGAHPSAVRGIVEAVDEATAGVKDTEFRQYTVDPAREARDRKAAEDATYAQAKALLALNEQREKEARIYRTNVQMFEFSGYGPQTYEDWYASQPHMQGPQTYEQWIAAGQPVVDDADVAKDPQRWATNAASAVTSAIMSASMSLMSGLGTLGSVASAFWQSLVGDIVGILGRMGIGSLLGAIGGSIAGPFGGFIGAIGGKLLGKNSVASPRGGNTFILNGLNTRDMYMELTSGSLRRANDLVMMRGAEVGA